MQWRNSWNVFIALPQACPHCIHHRIGVARNAISIPIIRLKVKNHCSSQLLLTYPLGFDSYGLWVIIGDPFRSVVHVGNHGVVVPNPGESFFFQ